MDRKQLQEEILSKPYQREAWLTVLSQVFNVQVIHQNPRNIVDLPTNNIIDNAFELGILHTTDEREVGIYELILKDEASTQIARNKVQLRNLLRNIFKNIVDGALIVFKHNEKWRFSYVSDIRTEDGRKETEPKRYTYLFGPGESCRTAAQRFYNLIGKPIALNDLYDAFSVEKLNREFFKTYKEFYIKGVEHIVGTKAYYDLLVDRKADEEDKKQKPIRDFVKKLLGRIVFLHFLQKKGWLGCETNTDKWENGDPRFMYNLFLNFGQKEQFNSKCLNVLFFETLNTNRYKSNFLAPKELWGTTGGFRIPYLNGGLFDKDISWENPIDFPADFFASLFPFFESYNFTIDENDPYENEVGIDPEMLGHIFENLLEENRERGAFYTPKEIVHYMCQESLIQYLRTHLPQCADDDSPATKEIKKFIRYGLTENRQDNKNFVVANAQTIEKLLDGVKICDPAIGSGAFPMGMLQEIFKAKTTLDLTLDKAQVKKDIIQNNIYGVDIEAGAVDIARLRFWLALVVDEDTPQPLPNLDYKIMQGNSLLEQFEDIDLKFEKKAFEVALVKEVDLFGKPLNPQITITDYLQTQQDLKEFDITELETKYFNSNNPTEKQAIREKIEAFEKVFIDEQLQKKLEELESKLSDKEIELNNYQTALNNSSEGNTPAQKRNYEKALQNIERKKREIEKLQKEIERLGQKRIELAEITLHNKPYFLWHLYFMDVFDNGGFDIVIGNPPYIQLKKLGIDEVRNLEIAGFDTFAKTGDMYCLFYELGNNVLKQEGVLSFITSNKWMTASYGKPLRQYLLQNTNPSLLIDFSKAVVFPAAVVFVNILNFVKGTNHNNTWAVKAQTDYQAGKTILHEYVAEKGLKITELGTDNWAIADKGDFDIINIIDEKGMPLKEWDIEFFRGITSGLNEAFHIKEEDRQELITQDPKSEEIIKPLLRGKDIKRYSYEYADKYIIFTKHGIDINNYPAIKAHLNNYREDLIPKLSSTTLKGRKPGNYEWYEIQDNTAYYHYLEKEKIIWIEISDRANYCLDTQGHFLTNSAYFLTGKHLKYLLGVLNSKIMDFYFFQKTAQIAGGRKRYTKQYVELLPIVQPTDEAATITFNTIVDYLIYLNDDLMPPVNPYTQNNNIAPVFEDVLNMMVYELYFGEHMKEQEIDVLKFIDTKEVFLDITTYKNQPEKQADIIGSAYKWLQQQENPVRNRIILSNIRSKDRIARINSAV